MGSLTINSVLEDTCVLATGAYALVRGPFERILAQPFWCGLLAGAAGATEPVMAGARYPFGPPTLACAVATALAGPLAGLVAAGVVTLASLLFDLRNVTIATFAEMAIVIALLSLAGTQRRVNARHIVLLAVAQLVAVLAVRATRLPVPHNLDALATVPANAFGLALLGLVVHDARVRAAAERRKEEIEQARRVAGEAQVAVLRSRIQPHFLFNALNSIAALCLIAPERASQAAVRLGNVLRRSLDTDFGRTLSLGEEVETVREFLAIEQERHGERLRVRIDIEGFEAVRIPAFAVQILVENAVLHGVSRTVAGGEVAIVARQGRNGTIVAVADEGSGPPPTPAWRTGGHGLGILSSQLHALCGAQARLRLVRRPKGGVLAVFCVPSEARP